MASSDVLAEVLSTAAIVTGAGGWYFTPPRGWRPTVKHRPRPDYGKIAAMEEEIYGHTWSGDAPNPTPREARATEARNRDRELAEQSERLLRDQARWNIPDPNWTDEDGRPW